MRIKVAAIAYDYDDGSRIQVHFERILLILPPISNSSAT